MNYYNPFDNILTGFLSRSVYENIGIDGPTGWSVYRVHQTEIQSWVEKQPAHMYEKYEIDLQLNLWKTYIFSPELESWFLLKWK